MADYSDDGLDDGAVEEYEIRTNGRRVKRGRVLEQVQEKAIREALAARRGGRAIFTLGSPENPR